MKEFIRGFAAFIIGVLLLYGGFSYRGYILFDEAARASWKNGNYLASEKLMNAYEESFGYRGLSFFSRGKDAFLYRKAWVALALGDTERAAKEFLGLANSPSEGADALFAYGVLKLNPNDLSISKDAFQKTLTRAPDHYAARVNLELLLFEQERQDAARKELERQEKKGDKPKDRDRTRDLFRFKDLPNQESGSDAGGVRY